MLSVIAPSCNEQNVLPAFIYSLAVQDCQEFELIIVDCGSSDGSPEFLRSISEKTRPIHIIQTAVKNMGIVRNKGAKQAKGRVLVHTNSDTFLPGQLLKKISRRFLSDQSLAALSGRTIQLRCSFLKRLANDYFDVARSILAYFHVFRPGGSLIAVRKDIFNYLNGFPPRAVNEDGRFGERLTAYKTRLDLHLKVFHYGKPGRGILFYLYTLANFVPFLRYILKDIERISAQRYYDQPC